jgi:hypothetical protein
MADISPSPFPLPFGLTKPQQPQPLDAISAETNIPTKITKETQSGWSPTSKENGLTDSLATGSFASHSTSALLAAAEEPLVLIATPAPCVGTSPMDLQDALPDNIFLIITRLKASAWEIALRDAGILDEFSDIPVGLRKGFFCGLEIFLLSCTSTPCNHYTSQEDEDFVIM